MKIITIHQPNYIPWLGFFAKIKKADYFVILDTVKYSKNSVINRNKIRTKYGSSYLTIPIGKKYHSSTIHDVKLPERNDWKEDHWKTIETNYKNSEFFSSYEYSLKKIYSKDYEYMWQINEELIIYLLNCFDIKTEIIKASELDINYNLHKTDLLISIVKLVNASTYLSGPSGKNYLEREKFIKEQIQLDFFRYDHPVYKQRFKGFIPNLSAIDILFNLGEKSKELI